MPLTVNWPGCAGGAAEVVELDRWWLAVADAQVVAFASYDVVA
jgi:hypothetical protein